MFKRDTQIRFSHCDAAGVAFFPRLFDLLNDANEDWFAGPLGHSFRHLHLEARLGVPTAHVDATFHAPLRLGDIIQQSVELAALGASSCRLKHQIHRGDKLAAAFDQTLVCVSLDTFRPVAWPAPLRAALNAFQESHP
ncbi:MAG: acyl-CoA thioesterase [Hyphomonadaceae bacterium]